MPTSTTAEEFEARLRELATAEQRAGIQRYFKTGRGQYAEGDLFLGVRMGEVFRLAAEAVDMPPDQLEVLLESPVHEVRAGALSIMDKQARRKATPDDRRRELYELYLRRTDRIDNWDLVDLAAPYVVGGYLVDRPRDVLDRLARSGDVWERRTAVVATAYFLRAGQIDDTYRIAEILLTDPHDLVRKAVGGWLREAGKKDPDRLRRFLDRHAASMPRTMLRYAIERLDPAERAHYRGLRSPSVDVP